MVALRQRFGRAELYTCWACPVVSTFTHTGPKQSVRVPRGVWESVGSLRRACRHLAPLCTLSSSALFNCRLTRPSFLPSSLPHELKIFFSKRGPHVNLGNRGQINQGGRRNFDEQWRRKNRGWNVVRSEEFVSVERGRWIESSLSRSIAVHAPHLPHRAIDLRGISASLRFFG